MKLKIYILAAMAALVVPSSASASLTLEQGAHAITRTAATMAEHGVAAADISQPVVEQKVTRCRLIRVGVQCWNHWTNVKGEWESTVMVASGHTCHRVAVTEPLFIEEKTGRTWHDAYRANGC